jgi:hypothetical protein
MHRIAILTAALLSPAVIWAQSPDKGEFFELKIRPLLTSNCFGCHTTAASGGLRLDSRGAVLKGGKSGAAITPGKPEQSLLVQAVSYKHERLKMPPPGKLQDEQIADLTRWIRDGAVWPESAGAQSSDGFAITPRQRAWWAYQPLQDPAPNSAIDRFILSKLKERGLRPAPLADKRTLIRRATYDLTGLPPSPAEIEAFLADRSQDAFAKLVDRLLASPHYGERWGRHWLDLVRYADTAGNNGDFPVPQAYLYRDYVIASVNRDKPYDQFVREQIAGDLLPARNEDEYWEHVTATGYLANGHRFDIHPGMTNPLTVADIVDNLGDVFLGLSVKCARCHNHKFDAISARDYYALYGIFDSVHFPFPGSENLQQQREMFYRMDSAQARSIMKPVLARQAAPDSGLKELLKSKTAMGPPQDEFNAQLRDILKDAPRLPKLYAVSDGVPHNARIQRYGEPRDLGDEAPRGFLQILGGQRLPPDVKGSGRLQLAEWLTDPKNPLTARVMVNRIWQHHFGKGLVATSSNFGERGQPPSHPELLDYLASRFIASGWSMKAMHRLMMLSQAYQLASEGPESNLAADPDNKLLWKFNRRRLDAEEIRDSLLMMGGALDLSGSPGPHPFPAEETWQYTIHQPFSEAYGTNRRSVYLMVQRSRRHPYLALFDGADPNSGAAERTNSTSPLQALFFMNSGFVAQMASQFAAELIASDPDLTARVDRAYRRVLGRPPEREEIGRALDYLATAKSKLAASKCESERMELALASYLRALVQSNEFLFVD